MKIGKREYRAVLGFAINGKPLPDPSAYSGKTSDLDASGERDITGLLHRDMVAASKTPVSMSWSGLGWDAVTYILGLMHNRPQFKFQFPDPEEGGLRTGDYYVGDREWTAQSMINGDEDRYLFDLKCSIIEY